MLDSGEAPCAQGFLYKKGGFKGKDEEEEEEAVNAAAAEEVRHLFEAYDEDGDGTLSPAEIKKLSRELGKELSKSELVSRHDIAGIWVAFFQECQRYRCGQAPTTTQLSTSSRSRRRCAQAWASLEKTRRRS